MPAAIPVINIAALRAILFHLLSWRSIPFADHLHTRRLHMGYFYPI